MAKTFFSTRSGGVSKGVFESFNLAQHVGDLQSDVQANREILAERIGIPLSRIFYMNQVHGNSVYEVTEESDFENPPEADALFTKRKDCALVTLIADCTPLLLSSKAAIAAVHVGRKGLVAGIFEETLKKFISNGITPKEIEAEIGPAICGKCYELDLATYEEVVAAIPEASFDSAKRCVDVTAGLAAKLRKEGISYKASAFCVQHQPGYFSYRRDGITGRQAGVIWQ
ncbi:MAG: peptidoglycan editing factor PgeF [Actinomycetales bacterium]